MVYMLALLSLVPQPPVAVPDTVSAIEINRFYDPRDGELHFVQAIFRDVDEIVDFRLLSRPYRPPQYDYRRRQWVFWVNDSVSMRRVVARTVYRTWTLYDPEVAERQTLPLHKRRGLSRREAKR